MITWMVFLPEPSEGYFPSVMDGFDAESRFDSSAYDGSQALDKSWMQLEQKPVEFFWESGFGRKFLMTIAAVPRAQL